MLYEYAPGHRRPRPTSASLAAFGWASWGTPVECVGRRERIVLFRSHGRYFQVEVISGRHAHRLRHTVIAMLSSIRTPSRSP